MIPNAFIPRKGENVLLNPERIEIFMVPINGVYRYQFQYSTSYLKHITVQNVEYTAVYEVYPNNYSRTPSELSLSITGTEIVNSGDVIIYDAITSTITNYVKPNFPLRVDRTITLEANVGVSLSSRGKSSSPFIYRDHINFPNAFIQTRGETFDCNDLSYLECKFVDEYGDLIDLHTNLSLTLIMQEEKDGDVYYPQIPAGWEQLWKPQLPYYPIMYNLREIKDTMPEYFDLARKYNKFYEALETHNMLTDSVIKEIGNKHSLLVQEEIQWPPEFLEDTTNKINLRTYFPPPVIKNNRLREMVEDIYYALSTYPVIGKGKYAHVRDKMIYLDDVPGRDIFSFIDSKKYDGVKSGKVSADNNARELEERYFAKPLERNTMSLQKFIPQSIFNLQESYKRQQMEYQKQKEKYYMMSKIVKMANGNTYSASNDATIKLVKKLKESHSEELKKELGIKDLTIKELTEKYNEVEIRNNVLDEFVGDIANIVDQNGGEPVLNNIVSLVQDLFDKYKNEKEAHEQTSQEKEDTEKELIYESNLTSELIKIFKAEHSSGFVIQTINDMRDALIANPNLSKEEEKQIIRDNLEKAMNSSTSEPSSEDQTE